MPKEYIDNVKPLTDKEVEEILARVDPDEPLPEVDPVPLWSELRRNTVGYPWEKVEAAVRAAVEEKDEDKRGDLLFEALRQLNGGRVYAEVLESDFGFILKRCSEMYRRWASLYDRRRS